MVAELIHLTSAQTAPVLLLITVVVLAPVVLAQLVGLALKSRRELGWWRKRGALTVRRGLDVLATHAGVVTIRGWTLLLLGCFLTLVALGLQRVEHEGPLHRHAAAFRHCPDRFHLALGQGAGVVQQAADQGRLAVVDMADDDELHRREVGIGMSIHRAMLSYM